MAAVARRFCENLTKATDDIIGTLQELAAAKGAIFIWAPDDNDGLAKLLGSYQKWAATTTAAALDNLSVHLLIRHGPSGGRRSRIRTPSTRSRNGSPARRIGNGGWPSSTRTG